MKTFHHKGRKWLIKSESTDQIVLIPAPNLTAWRKKKNLTQRTAAELLGISQTHLAKIERAQRSLPPHLLPKLK